ncbi:YbjN domain-containing protein [Actinomyces trachealis]|uniref:YbjN domain-containing protein n=1 Tax=Actinomyces trachealis TaxID=2763540 RepID=UPI0018929E97|nr:YbjN domain-containing protein [Actinomyces trachealis]
MPTPLTVERIAALFKERDYVFFIDSDGDLGGTWEDATFYFLLHGENKEVLHVRAQYPGTVDVAYLEKVREVMEASHRSRPWPKAFYRIDDDGDIRVYAAHTVDYEHGVTDAQILQHVDCAIGSILHLFASLNEALGR